MTRYSQNGYPACVPSLLAHYETPGVPINYVMRRGATATVLLYVVQRWDKEIEPVTSGGCYACRDIIGSATTSNHASATAVDINPGKHPLGTNASIALRTKVHRILNTRIGGIRVGDVVRYGGDYHGRKDPMHIEINARLALVTRLAQAILHQHPPVPTPHPQEDDMLGIVMVTGRAAKFLYDGFRLDWIQDGDHLSRLDGEYFKRTSKHLVTTSISSPVPIQEGKYGWLNPADPGPAAAEPDVKPPWDFSLHRKVNTK